MFSSFALLWIRPALGRAANLLFQSSSRQPDDNSRSFDRFRYLAERACQSLARPVMNGLEGGQRERHGIRGLAVAPAVEIHQPDRRAVASPQDRKGRS